MRHIKLLGLVLVTSVAAPHHVGAFPLFRVALQWPRSWPQVFNRNQHPGRDNHHEEEHSNSISLPALVLPRAEEEDQGIIKAASNLETRNPHHNQNHHYPELMLGHVNVDDEYEVFDIFALLSGGKCRPPAGSEDRDPVCDIECRMYCLCPTKDWSCEDDPNCSYCRSNEDSWQTPLPSSLTATATTTTTSSDGAIPVPAVTTTGPTPPPPPPPPSTTEVPSPPSSPPPPPVPPTTTAVPPPPVTTSATHPLPVPPTTIITTTTTAEFTPVIPPAAPAPTTTTTTTTPKPPDPVIVTMTTTVDLDSSSSSPLPLTEPHPVPEPATVTDT